MRSLSIVIPAYNEAQSIVPVVDDVLRKAEGAQAEIEIILVNDGSTDDTEKFCRYACNKYPSQVYLVNHPRNMGMGAALKSGFREAHGDWWSFLPADGQIDFDQLKLLIDAWDEDALGYHVYKERESRLRAVTSWGLRFLLNVLGIGGGQLDGVYLFHRKWLPKPELAWFVSNTFVFNFEVMGYLSRRIPNKRAVEITPHRRKSGKSKELNLRKMAFVFCETLKVWMIRIRYRRK